LLNQKATTQTLGGSGGEKNQFFAAINIYQGLLNLNTAKNFSSKGFTYRFSWIFIAAKCS